jgi:flagellar M-ring protein FliF
MDFFKTQFDRIQQQLGGLNASQKMLSACLVVIIVMTVLWWGRYAATAEMEPLPIDQTLSAEDVGRVKNHLRGAGIAYEISGDNKVMVPSARVPEALATLTFSGALPRAPRIDFAALVKDMNPFNPSTINDAQLNNIKQLRLAEVISNYPDVRSAQVFIDASDNMHFGAARVQPSATVSIQMAPGVTASQQLVDSAARLLTGAQAGLTLKNVSVIANGVPRRVRDADEDGGMDGSEYLKMVEEVETRVEKKVANFFSIPQLTVTVSFKVAQESSRTESKTFDKDNIFQKATEESEKTSESSTPVPAAAGEPGALPNTGMTIASAPASGGQATTTETETRSKFQVLAGETVKQIKTPAGVATPVAAAVRLPRSYIINALKCEWKNPNPKADPNAEAPEPDESAIQARYRQELPDLRTAVQYAAGLPSDRAVLVSLYADRLPRPSDGLAPGTIEAGITTASVTAMAGAHSREIVLGGLAVVSLFMVSMMVRRASPLPAAAAAGIGVLQTPMPILDATEGLVGEVSEGKQLLDAMELDEDAVRAQQMLDQVSSMVEENPDAAAGLVKRWLNRS